jgi:DNA-binding GntR family transcriptional regulator
LLVEQRLIHDQHGVPIELTESRYVAARYGLDVDFEVELPL